MTVSNTQKLETLELQINGTIATLCMTLPTMPPKFFKELPLAFSQIQNHAEVRAVILKSTAKSFSYGLDLPAAFKEHGELFTGTKAVDRVALLSLIEDMQSCLHAVSRCPLPVLSLIHGHCIGGGIDLITCSDIRLATQETVFSVRETKVAMVADLGTLQRLPALIGQGHTRELALRGCDISATRAAEIGLINHVYNDMDTMQQEAHRIAEEIARNPPLTVRGVKKVLDFGRDHGANAGLAYVSAWNAAFFASEDLEEAMEAFIGKRAPAFKGR